MKNQRLIDLRKNSGLTQGQLGEIIDVSQGMIARIEAGNREPRKPIKIKLAKHFKVTVEWLFYEQVDYQRSCTGTDGL